jgi:hypothetical protein
MLARLALIACALCALQPAVAAEPASDTNTCRLALPMIREAWQQGAYDTSPALAAVMVDAIDGKLARVREGLAALPAAGQAHWRQVATMTAANTYQPAVVDGLLDDGAAVEGKVRLPPFKSAVHDQLLDSMDHDAHFGGPGTVKAMQSTGLMDGNRGLLVGPMVSMVASCEDAATLEVLLRHHANPMARSAPNVADALTLAVINGHAAITTLLLDHGADVCEDDRHFHKPGITLASLSRRNHLPEALVQRLTCHEPATAAVR